MTESEAQQLAQDRALIDVQRLPPGPERDVLQAQFTAHYVKRLLAGYPLPPHCSSH